MRLLLSEPPSASVLTPVTRAARGAARRPLHIEVHRLRLLQEGLGLSVPLARALGPLRSAGPGNSVAGRAASLNRPAKDSGNEQGPSEQDQGRPRGGRKGARLRPGG